MLRNFPTDSGGIHRRHKPKFTLSPQSNEQLRPDFNRSACQLTTLRLQLSLSPRIFTDQLLQILLKINKIQSKDFCFFFCVSNREGNLTYETRGRTGAEPGTSTFTSGQWAVFGFWHFHECKHVLLVSKWRYRENSSSFKDKWHSPNRQLDGDI